MLHPCREDLHRYIMHTPFHNWSYIHYKHIIQADPIQTHVHTHTHTERETIITTTYYLPYLLYVFWQLVQYTFAHRGDECYNAHNMIGAVLVCSNDSPSGKTV